MYKKIFTMLITSVVFFSGCQSAVKASQSSLPESQSNIVAPALNETSIQLQVPKEGGAFSGKDLIYFIMTDRFYDGSPVGNQYKDVNKNNSKAYHGGDFLGITKKLDYIKSLGTTAIWITPVAENSEYGYHGYWINDFYKVDPHLGTIEDLSNMVAEAHKRDIKVIIDYVANHTSSASPWVNDPDKSSWFHPKMDIANWNNPEELEKGWIYGLPDLDQHNPEVKAFLIENALWWIAQTDIDGMRLDTVRHVSKSFWNEFAFEIKSKYPDFYLLGEVWDDNPRYLEQFHDLGIDGLTDYPLFKGIRSAFTRFGNTGSLINAIELRNVYSHPELNGIFIDNHDNKRLISQSSENSTDYLKQSLAFIMTYPSIPVIYYGTEIGMEGGDDPDNRRDMKWADIKDSEILKFYRKLVELRSANISVREGSFALLDHDSRFLSYIREKDGKSFIVVLNVLNKEKEVTVNIPTPSLQYEDILTNKKYIVADQVLKITLQPLEMLLLESK